MYLSAQHVRTRADEHDFQAYLHLHGIPGSEPFPADPLSVPQGHPGLMVRKKLLLPPGGNAVISYLDIVAHDSIWNAIPSTSLTSTAWWHKRLEPVGDLMAGDALPWVVEAGDAHVIFNASALPAPAEEYSLLLNSALRLWEEWRVMHNHP